MSADPKDAIIADLVMNLRWCVNALEIEMPIYKAHITRAKDAIASAIGGPDCPLVGCHLPTPHIHGDGGPELDARPKQ